MAEGSVDSAQLRRVSKFLDKLKGQGKVEPNYERIIILSDSKGKYLRNNIRSVSEFAYTSDIIFWAQGGRTTKEGVDFLREKINTRSPLLNGNCIVLFWHTTCDLTVLKKPGRYLEPAFIKHEDAVSCLKQSFQKLMELKHSNSFHVGLLEIPPVFPSIWNKKKGHPSWKDFNDTEINLQIDAVNNYIRDVNEELNYVSPKFGLDCMKFRGKKGQGHKSYLTSELFVDGIHPCDLASQKWLFQIAKSVSRNAVW